MRRKLQSYVLFSVGQPLEYLVYVASPEPGPIAQPIMGFPTERAADDYIRTVYHQRVPLEDLMRTRGYNSKRRRRAIRRSYRRSFRFVQSPDDITVL